MTSPDPLVDLPRPTGDPAGIQLAAARYAQVARDLGVAAQALRERVATGTAADVWVGETAASAADVGGRLARAYETTAAGAAAGAQALTTCAQSWNDALGTYRRARTLADEALREEAARPVAAGAAGLFTDPVLRPPGWTGPERAQARALARTALDEVETASATCAAALDRAAGALAPAEPCEPATPVGHKKHWWDRGVVGSVVHVHRRERYSTAHYQVRRHPHAGERLSHVEIRNAGGKRIDPDGAVATQAAPETTPLLFGICRDALLRARRVPRILSRRQHPTRHRRSAVQPDAAGRLRPTRRSSRLPPTGAREPLHDRARVRDLHGRRSAGVWRSLGIRPAIDATDRIDYGGVDTFTFEGRRYELTGDFGVITVEAGPPSVELDPPSS